MMSKNNKIHLLLLNFKPELNARIDLSAINHRHINRHTEGDIEGVVIICTRLLGLNPPSNGICCDGKR